MSLVNFEVAKLLNNRVYSRDGYFTKSGIEYFKPQNDSSFSSLIGKIILDWDYCEFECDEKINDIIVYAPNILNVRQYLEDKHIYIMIDKSFSVESGWHYVICVNNDFDNLITQEVLKGRTWNEAMNDAIEYSLKNLMKDEEDI